MDKDRPEHAEHGRLLSRAMRIANLNREAVGGLVGRGVRTVTHWTSGGTMPTEAEKTVLRKRLGPYDRYPDLVEFALHTSELTDDRADTVTGYYKKQLREQREGHDQAG